MAQERESGLGRRRFLLNSLLFTVGLSVRQWPFRTYSFPTPLPRPHFTTWWHREFATDFKTQVVTLKWVGGWSPEVQEGLPILPALTEKQFQTMLALKGKEDKVITQDDLKRILAI